MELLREALKTHEEVPLLDDFEIAELEAGLEELRNDIEQSESAIDETYRLIAGLESIDPNDVEMAKVRLESMFLYSDQASRFKDFEVGKDSLDGLVNGLIAGCEAEKEGLFAKLKKLKRDYLSAYGSRIRKLKEVREKLKGDVTLNSSVDMGSSIIGIATSDSPAKSDKDIAKNVENYVSVLTEFFDKWIPDYETKINKVADRMAEFKATTHPIIFAEYTFIVLTAVLDTSSPDKHFALKKGLYSKSKEDRVSNVLLGGLRFLETSHEIRIRRGADVDWRDVLDFSSDVNDFQWTIVKDNSTPPSTKIDIADIKSLISICDNAIKLLETTEKTLKNEIIYPFFKMGTKTKRLANEVRNPNNPNTPQSIVARRLNTAIYKWRKNPKNDLLKNTLKVTGSVITFLNKAVK